MNRFFVALLLLGAPFLCASLSDGYIGSSISCINSDCLVSASASYGSLLVSVGLILFLYCYKQQENIMDDSKLVGLWQRLGAFYLDFSFVIVCASPFTTLPILLAEANYTGAFQWYFIREFSRPTDTQYVLPAIFAAFLILFFYFFKHLQMSRQTLGEYALGYRIIQVNEYEQHHAKRVALGFIGLCAWPVSVILALRDPKKTCWWDTSTNTIAVRVI